MKTERSSTAILLVFFAVQCLRASAFSLSSTSHSPQLLTRSRSRKTTSNELFWTLQASTENEDHINQTGDYVLQTCSKAGSRRQFVATATGTISLAAFAGNTIAVESSPICVIGANGRTGSQCVQACVERGIPVRATSRSGTYNGDSSSKLVALLPCDVTKPATISRAIERCQAVIFCASASKNRGTPSQVDNDGLVNVARACLAQKIPHLVVVSSGAVTKPNSPVFQFLNLFGKIMEEKIKGEDEVRRLYSMSGNQPSLVFTVIRPGGLTEDAPRGVTALELNQGDTKSGRIARADVAALCIEATRYPGLTGFATFECYDSDTGKPLSTVGISNILKQKAAPADFTSGTEQVGETFEKLFTGLQRD
jgi:hypothetical protein